MIHSMQFHRITIIASLLWFSSSFLHIVEAVNNTPLSQELFHTVVDSEIVELRSLAVECFKVMHYLSLVNEKLQQTLEEKGFGESFEGENNNAALIEKLKHNKTYQTSKRIENTCTWLIAHEKYFLKAWDFLIYEHKEEFDLDHSIYLFARIISKISAVFEEKPLFFSEHQTTKEKIILIKKSLKVIQGHCKKIQERSSDVFLLEEKAIQNALSFSSLKEFSIRYAPLIGMFVGLSLYVAFYDNSHEHPALRSWDFSEIKKLRSFSHAFNKAIVFDHMKASLVSGGWAAGQFVSANPIAKAKDFAENYRLQQAHIKKNEAEDFFKKFLFKKNGAFTESIMGNKNLLSLADCLIDCLRNPLKYKRFGAIIPRGVLLEGAPGTGKTLLMRKMAQAGISCFNLTANDLVGFDYLSSKDIITYLYEEAARRSPCIIFIDEFDAVRGDGDKDVYSEIITNLLTTWDGMKQSSAYPVMTIVASNFADKLPEALIRPGRIDIRIHVEEFNKETQVQMIEKEFKELEEAFLPLKDNEKLLFESDSNASLLSERSKQEKRSVDALHTLSFSCDDQNFENMPSKEELYALEGDGFTPARRKSWMNIANILKIYENPFLSRPTLRHYKIARSLVS